MTDFIGTNCLGGCSPTQILTLNYAINDISSVVINNNCGAYDTASIQYSYSLDNICYSCYMSYDDILANTIELNSDFYLR